MSVLQTEGEGIAALQRGDIRGLEVLVHLHQTHALRIAYAITRERTSAEDVVADAFIAVYESARQFDARRPFKSWFYRMVVNRSLNTVRRESRSHASVEGSRLDRSLSTPEPETETVSHESRLDLTDAVACLPPKLRAVLVLRYDMDLDERTIAKTLGCPIGTVKWRLHAAHARLREELADRQGWAASMEGGST